jgi:2-keto-3-deoxy-6-phosphogluconate aldolase
VPTGGIALRDAATWLAAGAIAVGVGSDLLAADDMAVEVTTALAELDGS